MIKLQKLIVLTFSAKFFAFLNIFRIIGRHLTTFIEAPRNPYETMLKPLTFFVISTKEKWAATWQNQQCGCAPSEDADQPGHPPSLIRVCPVWSESSLSAWRNLGSLAIHWAHSEDSGRTLILLVLSCRGSNVKNMRKLFLRKMLVLTFFAS